MKSQTKGYYWAQEIANMLGISKSTLFSWESNGLISEPPKDWRGWRMYNEKHVEEIRKIIERKKGSVCK